MNDSHEIKSVHTSYRIELRRDPNSAITIALIIASIAAEGVFGAGRIE